MEQILSPANRNLGDLCFGTASPTTRLYKQGGDTDLKSKSPTRMQQVWVACCDPTLAVGEGTQARGPHPALPHTGQTAGTASGREKTLSSGFGGEGRGGMALPKG